MNESGRNEFEVLLWLTINLYYTWDVPCGGREGGREAVASQTKEAEFISLLSALPSRA